MALSIQLEKCPNLLPRDDSASGCTTVTLEEFLPRYNKRFAVPASEPGVAYRPWPQGLRLEEVFCFKYVRTVGADNTVKLGEHRLQLEPSTERASYAHLRVEVHERLDGSLGVYHAGKRVGTKEAPKEAPALRARKGTRGALKPAEGKGRDGLGDDRGVEAGRRQDACSTKTAARSSVPGSDHPWRKPYKRTMVTKSLNA